MVIYLLVQLGLDRIEQVLVNDGGLLACQGLPLEDHLSDIKPIAKEISERAACEGNSEAGFPLATYAALVRGAGGSRDPRDVCQRA